MSIYIINVIIIMLIKAIAFFEFWYYFKKDFSIFIHVLINIIRNNNLFKFFKYSFRCHFI